MKQRRKKERTWAEAARLVRRGGGPPPRRRRRPGGRRAAEGLGWAPGLRRAPRGLPTPPPPAPGVPPRVTGPAAPPAGGWGGRRGRGCGAGAPVLPPPPCRSRGRGEGGGGGLRAVAAGVPRPRLFSFPRRVGRRKAPGGWATTPGRCERSPPVPVPAHPGGSGTKCQPSGGVPAATASSRQSRDGPSGVGVGGYHPTAVPVRYLLPGSLPAAPARFSVWERFVFFLSDGLRLSGKNRSLRGEAWPEVRCQKFLV